MSQSGTTCIGLSVFVMVFGITAAMYIENKLLNAVIVVVMIMRIAPTPIHVRCFSPPDCN